MRRANVLIGLLSLPAFANEAQFTSTESLKHLTLEELLNVQVSSVSKTAEPIGAAAAAIAVVSGDDIERSGATSVPEALRLVPGLHVARRTASTWALSSRGFSSASSEKLLVLSDTRSIYTPLFSGVFWDVQDYLLEDIDRIEVIRGPGAALWGSNAMNGVINITTKSARDTQGLYLEADAGTEQLATAAARYGGQSAGGIYWRVFGKYTDNDSSFHSNRSLSDDWRLAHGGFRADWDIADAGTLTLQSDIYRGNVGQLSPSLVVSGRPEPTGDLEAEVSGGNLLGRWQRTLSADSDLQLRAYYDRTHRDDPTFTDDLDTMDVDFQHRFAPGAAQQVVWGLGYRLMRDRFDGKGAFVGALQPSVSHDELVSGFVQDQIALSESVRLILGTKLGHNDFSGFEVQPSVRAAWEVSRSQTLWAAVSRAVRVPTRIERDLSIDASNPAANRIFRLLGNRDFEGEELLAYEVGHRSQVSSRVSLDFAGFHNRYQRLASLELGTAFIDPATGKTIVPVVNRNLTDGHATGAEMQATFSPSPYWQLSGTWSYVSLHLVPHGLDLSRRRLLAAATPRNQLGLRSSLDLPAGFELDAQLRHLTAIDSSPQITPGTRIPAYAELDVRLAWRATERVELSVVGQNLLHAHHAELGTVALGGEIERSVYGRVALRY